MSCPKCGSDNIEPENIQGTYYWYCYDCKEWSVDE